jgi:hypothetical protein
MIEAANHLPYNPQEEMVGILTAISIVSKRLANRLLKNMERKEPENEQNQTCTGRGC